ncbi:hypothetical protein PYCCODRAFT_1362821 [Trametes coccinea BRFM310]|uniref:Rab-GAP TBC domain-containing protein n=1 Tax=Trametes coccinea (strain BRFM310) TaxID=1353009 RepID=A0A1Y2IWU1_TRAC3|nr:hypothetical protein PYCCODRAFT_1362821 [Trametes coccinea BRFM310]
MDDGAVTVTCSTADGELDWQALRDQSIRPYGFGEERVRIWPKLLHVDPEGEVPRESTIATGSSSGQVSAENEHESNSAQEEQPHEDERQIGLDTDRSFVLYPVEDTAKRETLQAGLNRLIVSVFRRRPHLHYFQGYHDIVSVLFLTLPKEVHLPVTEKLSLHRVRDSMGTTLEPVVGLLRILKRILHLADEKFAAILEQAAPLPYYALSNLLTLFSHDVPTLPLIQHIFDYLLSRPPIAVVYLAAALTLTRRREVQVLEEEGEDGMMHSLLTGLPELYEEGDPASSGEHTVMVESEPRKEVEGEGEQELPHGVEKTDAPPAPGGSSDVASQSAPASPPPACPEETQRNDPEGPASAAEKVVPDSQPVEPESKPDVNSSETPDTETTNAQPLSELDAKPAEAATEPARIDEKASPLRTTSPDPLDMLRPHRPRVSLTSLLKHADELYAQFPPTHPDVAVSSIMGPQSVMLTWSERRAELPDDDEAELMVTKPELVVLPYVEPEDEDLASDEASSYRPTPARGDRNRKGAKEESEKEKRRRRLRKPRRLTDIVVQRRTMVAGAVLVLGVAMAVYGYNASLPGGGGHHRGGFGREWRKVGRFLGGALVGAGERVFEGLRRGLE